MTRLDACLILILLATSAAVVGMMGAREAERPVVVATLVTPVVGEARTFQQWCLDSYIKSSVLVTKGGGAWTLTCFADPLANVNGG